MADESKEQIASWLQDGLDAYGDGNTSEAIVSWRKVVAADPENVEALDFLQSADRREFPRGGKDDRRGPADRADRADRKGEAKGKDQPERKDPGDRAEFAQQDVIGIARGLIASGQYEESLELLQSANEASEFSIELEATIELVRSNLFATYLKSIGDLSAVPSLVADPAEITKFNLPKDAGFLLSLVDGVTSLANLMTVSGMDSFEVLRTTKNLIDVGIVSMQNE